MGQMKCPGVNVCRGESAWQNNEREQERKKEEKEERASIDRDRMLRCSFWLCLIDYPRVVGGRVSASSETGFEWWFLNLRSYFPLIPFVDVTLSCRNRTFRAHRVVLSACSPYLRDLLDSDAVVSGGGHPIVILQDATPEAVEHVIEFMYTGNVDIPSQCLSDFIKLAECFQALMLVRVASRSSKAILPFSSTASFTAAKVAAATILREKLDRVARSAQNKDELGKENDDNEGSEKRRRGREATFDEKRSERTGEKKNGSGGTVDCASGSLAFRSCSGAAGKKEDEAFHLFPVRGIKGESEARPSSSSSPTKHLKPDHGLPSPPSSTHDEDGDQMSPKRKLSTASSDFTPHQRKQFEAQMVHRYFRSLYGAEQAKPEAEPMVTIEKVYLQNEGEEHAEDEPCDFSMGKTRKADGEFSPRAEDYDDEGGNSKPVAGRVKNDRNPPALLPYQSEPEKPFNIPADVSPESPLFRVSNSDTIWVGKTYNNWTMYFCSLCPYQSRIKSHLWRHSVKHTGQKPFVCALCLKAFSRRDNLKQHMNYKHPGYDLEPKRDARQGLKLIKGV
ncbi:unnamed protein product [Notodromas monacha]|uniref:Uncharacterized protein n=1 Tax=Notodromas monacha TaxID=399045 RepID=A0A7R9GGE9_9CRUS|nr:unnamed protein product [Notodromas monacha]CAG0920321.1 unnamed protein product [Notodromas monacha]